ncbi:MFS transporter [Brevibacterium samyangense]
MTSERPALRASRREALPADIWVLVAAAFIVAIGYGLIAPVLPQFAESFGLGITASTVVVSSFAFFRLVCAPAGGRLVNRMGERWVYVTGLLIVAASTFAVALAQTYWQLLLSRGLGGLGSTMFSVSAMAIIIRITPGHMRARATGAYAQAFLIGNIAGPVVGGLMAGWGMRVPFVVYAVALVLAALVVRVRLGKRSDIDSPADGSDTDTVEAKGGSEESADSTTSGDSEAPDVVRAQGTSAGEGVVPRGEHSEGTEAETPAADADGLRGAARRSGRARARRRREHARTVLPRMRFREAWADSAYRAALLSGLALGWSSMGIRVALYPLFAVHVLETNSAAAGWALTVFAAGNALAVPAVGRWADTRGRRPFILTGLAIIAVSTLALAAVDSLWSFLALSAVAGIGAGFLNPSQQAVIADVVGSERSGGTVLSRYQMAVDAGAIFGPIVAGFLADQWGYPAAFIASGVLVVIAFAGWLGGRETLPGKERSLRG